MEKERQEAYRLAHASPAIHGRDPAATPGRDAQPGAGAAPSRGARSVGELALKRLAELAGMVEHSDFHEQVQIDTEEGRMRPDMVVRLPGGRRSWWMPRHRWMRI